MMRGRAAGLACAAPALSVPGPAAAAGQVELGDVRQAVEVVAQTDGVVGVIGEVYVDGKRVGQGTAGSRLLGGRGGRIPPGSRYRIASQTKLMEAAIVLQPVGVERSRRRRLRRGADPARGPRSGDGQGGVRASGRPVGGCIGG
ncbi:hypothetical protein [Nonomuraea sp. NPDC050643]|uniref:hypothetical protein n=1 Tax=Nonomuraea sp. NPDC050643 TaxID=3155660 RepID=UPI0033CD021E